MTISAGVTMTYNSGLKRYMMSSTDGKNTVARYDTQILEAGRITGPWSLVSTLGRFGERTYFVNSRARFLCADGRNAWLCYAANLTSRRSNYRVRPSGSRHHMCLPEVRLLSPSDSVPTGPLASRDNVASLATIPASSVYEGYSAERDVDGVVGGFPGDTRHESATRAKARPPWCG